MKRVINTRTKTVHKPLDEKHAKMAACGSLRNIPKTRIEVIHEEDLQPVEQVERCGNCFEDGNSY